MNPPLRLLCSARLVRASRECPTAVMKVPMSSPHETPEPGRSPRAVIASAIRLLGGDRGPVVDDARARLLRCGDEARAPLLLAAEGDQALLRVRARSVLRELEVRDCLRRFAALRLGRNGKSHAPALLDGALLLSQMVRTFVPDAQEIGTRLRAIAAELRSAFAGRSLPYCARGLVERLHGELGLHGVDAAVATPELDHVLLDRVLATKVGVPVTLSLVYLLVARWAGLSAAGVGLPGHFLVRLHGVRPILLDPFHGGRAVTKTDCARFLRASGHAQVRDQLRDLTDRDVLGLYLRSLQRATIGRGRPAAERTLDRARQSLEAL